MIKAMKIVIMMTVVSLAYQCFLAENTDYMISFDLFYWSTMTTVAFWGFGLLKTESL
jgi:hypothetical protein